MRSAHWLWLGAIAALPLLARAAIVASTPPMGWNSYDAYGTTVSEAQVRANALWMSQHLSRYGWRYVVIDAEWFVRNPTPSGGAAGSLLVRDQYGRYVPAPNRFPSSVYGAGLKPLADYVHSLGLKFGIHILRGIPREAVARNLPIAGSPYTAAQAVDIHSTCPWSPDNYGVDTHSRAGQAYYNSISPAWTTGPRGCCKTRRSSLWISKPPMPIRPSRAKGFVVWLSKPDAGGGWYLAAFNTQPRARTLTPSWRALALPPGRYVLRDMWQHRDLGAATSLSVHLDAHGAALYRLQPR